MNIIKEFRDEYFFLSNFYPTNVQYRGIVFKSSEAAFQAQKCPERSKEFANLEPDDSKHLGRKVKMRDDWDKVKDNIMNEIVMAKFAQNPELAKKLIDTKDAELQEGNWWGDKYWGIHNGEGQNKLGKILMRVRSQLLNAKTAHVIAVDFDGTLTTKNVYPDISGPNWPVANKVKQLQSEGNLICLWTCRQGKTLQEALDFCEYELDFIPDYINTTAFAIGRDYKPVKMLADYYIDDKAMSINEFLATKDFNLTQQ